MTSINVSYLLIRAQMESLVRLVTRVKEVHL